MFRLDFKSTPEYGNPDTGSITYEEGVFIYDTQRFSLPADTIADGGTLTENWNSFDTLTAKVYRESIPGATQAEKDVIWRDLAAQRTSVQMWSAAKEDYTFAGRISAAEENMDSQGRIYKMLTCESELAYLADSTVSLPEIYAEEGYNYDTSDNLFFGNAATVIGLVVAIHNKKTGGFAGNISKRFTVEYGPIYENGNYPYSILFYRSPYVPSGSRTENTGLHQDREIDTMSSLAMIQWIAERHGLSVSVKHDPNHPGTDEDGHLILYVEGIANENRQYGYKASPKIQLRQNMKSLKVSHNFSGTGRVTCITPLGGVGADGKRLDVSAQPQYNPITHEVFYSRSVQNFQLAATYGFVERIEIHDDLVDDGNKTAYEIDLMRTELYNRGLISAAKLNDKVTSIQVGALDMANAGVNVDAFEVGYYYDVVNEMLNYQSGGSTVVFDKTYQLLKKVTPLDRPWDASFTFGDEAKNVTKKTLSAQQMLKQQIYSTGNGIASRLDNAAFKRCSTKAEYTNFGTHRDETFYTVPEDGELHLYLGDERVMISGGGGDSFTVDYASVLSAEQSIKYTTGETMSVAAQCGMTAIYGGAPSRGVCNGYRVLFNVPYADITQEDVSSYLVLPNPQSTYPSINKAGQYTVFRCRLSEQTQTCFVITVYWTRYNADGTVQTSGNYSYSAAYSGSLSGLTFGMVADVSTIEEYDATWQAAGVYGRYRAKGHGQNGPAVTVKAWLNGAAVTLSFPTSGGTSDWFFIKSLAEWHFDLSLNKRYEPSGGV